MDDTEGDDGPPMSRRHEALAVAALAAAVFVFHLWWWYRNHEGAPWFIDEAGYLSFAIDHADAARSEGIAGWFSSLGNQAPYGPLVPALSSLLLLAVDSPFFVAAVSMAAWAAAFAVATWFLARTVLPARAAIASAAVAATLPTVLVLSDTYYFAVPAATLCAVGLACLARGGWGEDLRWSGAAGVAFGAALLARTMVLGVLGPVAVVTVLGAVAGRGRRWPKLRGVLVVAAGAAVVAAPWYVPNADAILDHLRAGSSGGGSAREGAGAAGVWRVRGVRDLRLLVNDLLVPMAVALALVVVAGLWLLARRRTRPGGTLGRLAAVVLLMAIVMVAAQEAVGQWVPVVAPAVVVGAAIVVRLPVPARRAIVAVVVLATAFDVVQDSRLVGAFDDPVAIDAGPMGRLFVVDNRTLLEDQLLSLRHVDDRGLRAAHDFIDTAVADVASAAQAAGEPGVLVVTGGFDPLVNVNAVVLADRLQGGGARLVIGAFPLEEGSDEELAGRLADPAAGQPNAVLSVAPSRRSGAARAAVHAQLLRLLPRIGFEELADATLPDGRQVSVWFRPRARLADNPTSAG